MTKGVHPDARAYVREVCAQLLTSRSQRDLARELDVHQSRVSTALNVGRCAPETLERAAAMAGRSPEEVRDALATSGGFTQGALPQVPPGGRVPRVEFALEPLVRVVRAYAPSAPPDDAAIVAGALQRWGMTAPTAAAIKEAVGTIARLRARLEQARELERLRWTLDQLRSGRAETPTDTQTSDDDDDR